MEALHPVLLNGTGFSLKVTTIEEDFWPPEAGGVCPGDVGFVEHAANDDTVANVARVQAAVLRSTFHAFQ
jgi:hypothetical protein